jgi:signal transduction histidine kinase
MNREKSLYVAVVSFVFNIMIIAGVLTGACYIVLEAVFPVSAPIFSPIIILLVSSIIGTSISAAASEKFLEPLNQLIKATKTVSTGDFTVRVKETDDNSEIADLIKNFNHMAEELGSIEMFRNDFINNFSHEFKTPIVSIRGFAKQLQNDDLPAEKRKEFTEIIVSEAERLTNMSANILLLTKFENQQYITDQTEFELDEQIRNCIILLEKQWSKKNIEIIIDLEPIKFFSNAEILSHLWINLVDNAIKYTNDNGHITIICRENEDNIQFRISDDGNGMDESTQKHIFDKFYQGDRSRTIQGNGLGLSIAKRIAELCGGEISVESKLGCGTTFTVILPKAQR